MNDLTGLYSVISNGFWAVIFGLAFGFCVYHMIKYRGTTMPAAAVTTLALNVVIVLKKVSNAVLAWQFYYNSLDGKSYLVISVAVINICDCLIILLAGASLALLAYRSRPPRN